MRARSNALESRCRRGLQHRRQRVRLLPGVPAPDRQSGLSSLTTAEASPCASRLTGRAPGSYPGTDWVRVPGRVPCRRFAGGPRRRGRMEKAPAYEAGGCRFDSCRRRSPRRSSEEQSTALRRRGSHVRVVPARPQPLFFHTPRWSRGEDTGPSTRKPGFDSPSRYSRKEQMPGSRAERRPVVTRKAGVRAPPWQQRSVVEKFRRVAANHETRVRLPPGRPSQHRNPWSSSNGEDAGAPHR
jgi:hypothetical protein